MSLVQTLFLGCSITKFNFNMAWGEDNSQANVTLAYDTSKSKYAASSNADGIRLNLNNIIKNNRDIATQNKYVLADSIPSSLSVDDHKRLWPTNNNGFKNYDGADPGFIGLNYDIVGCPVRFKYDALEFAGHLGSWKTLGSTSGKEIYEITIKGYSSLLNNSYLIINNYIGSISEYLGNGWAAPLISDLPSSDSPSLFRGNIPNVFNVYGFYESAGFGNSNVNETGASALQIYNFLRNSFAAKNKYNIYGGLIAKTIFQNNNILSTSSTLTPYNSDSASVESSSFEEMGICRNVVASDNVRRSLFRLDLSEVPAPPLTLRIPNSVITIGQFINIICDGAGYDYTVIFTNETSGNYTGTIKIKTVSRKAILSTTALKGKINELITQNSSVVSNYSYGQEFSDAPIRLMHIGGKQKRLYQTVSANLALKQTTMVFDPYRGTFMPLAPLTTNHYMVPDETFTRTVQIVNQGVGFVGQKKTEEDFYASTTMGEGYSRWQNNYKNVKTSSNGGPNDNYPIYNDIICPYFGTNGDTYKDSGGGDYSASSVIGSDSEARKVYWDKETHQLKIIFQKNDITRLLANAYYDGGEFIVIENELRAAGAGFDSWLTYCFDNFFSTHIEMLMKAYFNNTYGRVSYFKALSVIKWNSLGKQSGSMSYNNHPGNINIDSASPYIKSFYQDLNKVHDIMKTIHDTHYGKSYMVRTPMIRRYRDPESNKYLYDWQVSSDGAWEEEGTFIDDTMVVGSTVTDIFRDDDGKIQPILGFNANAEKSTKDDWLDTKLLQAQSGGMGAMHAAIQKEYRKFTSRNETENFFYFPLQHNLSPDTYAYIRYVSPNATVGGFSFGGATAINTGAFTTAQGDPIPSKYTYKMYVKAKAQEEIVYLNNNPRIILLLDSPIKIGGGKNECETSLTFTMLHDAILAHNYNRAFKNNLNPTNTRNGALLAWFMTSNARISDDINSSVRINDVSENIPIEPKATCPAFAAIPVQFNLATYGPWIDNPGYSGWNTESAINNTVGSVKVEENPDLVPWNYGGMATLDDYMCTTIDNSVGYQQIYENGDIGLVGISLIGAAFADLLVAGGPLVTNIGIEIGENGITSSYTLRTYTRKLGFFNKENTDRYKNLAVENFRQRKAINNAINSAQSVIKQNFANSIGSSSNDSTPKQLRWSPSKILVGANKLHTHKDSSLAEVMTSYNPTWYMEPYGIVSENTVDLPRYLGDVGLYETDEVPRELLTDYKSKSIMSLDGILSPISFYPTAYGTTYSITKYPRSRCPICLGAGEYRYKKLNSPGTYDSFNNCTNSIEVNTTKCCFCEKDDDKKKNKAISVSPKETTPPYIIASGNDLQIISINNLGGISGISGNPIINYSTLNPVLLISGEFGCSQNKQSNDFTAHSIDTIGNSIVAPYGEDSIKLSYSDNVARFYDPIDKNYESYCRINNITRPAYTEIPNYPNSDNLPANNMRFFGLRGPIMVHGWGYDTEGYPVPNASGEFKLNSDGSIAVDSDSNRLYKNQTQNPDGTWTKPYKEHKFFNGWGQLPGTWPVGPIDLRWDDKARLWTVGAVYKNVWIQIENDLVDKQPSRGQIISNSGNNPLPSGLRKLVFVKDELGINPAPRGAQIYCKYDSDSGFYEPIYNRPLITSGIIQGGSSADIYQMYNTNNATYRTTYSNPLGFDVSNGEKGLFVYIDKSWVLQAYRC